MADDVIDQPVETEVEEVESQESEELQTESDSVDPDEQETPVEDDSEEIEYEGEKYKVPKSLKDAFLRQSDYTRKTQEVAEQRRELEQRAQEFQQRAQLQQQHIQDFAQLHALDMEVKRFDKVDWQALIDQDPVEAMKLDRQYRSLTEARDSTAQRIRETEARESFEQQRQVATLLEKGHSRLKEAIPNWSPDRAKELKSFAVEVLGVDKNSVERILDPSQVIALHYAQIGYQTLKASTAKPKATEAKPVQKVQSKRDTSSVNPDKLSPDDWLKWREKQLRKR